MSTDATELGTKFPHIFAALAAPFEPGEIKRRKGGNGQMLDYVTARTVMNRLDEVVGPEGWTEEYIETKSGLSCRLTIYLPDGRAVVKQDGGAAAGMANADDDEKSAYSHAFKRAAVKHGIGRYLYRDGTADYGDDAGSHAPAEPPSRARGQDQPPRDRPPSNGNGQTPRSGRALFAWAKEQEEKHQVGLVNYLGKWCKLHDLTDRLVQLDDADVPQVYAEACRKLASLDSQERPADGGNGQDERLQNQKKELWGLICRLADDDRPDQHTVHRILDEIAGEAGGERIESVRDCKDSRLLGRSIVAAEGLLNQDAGV